MSLKLTIFIVVSFLFIAHSSSQILKLHGGPVMNFPISLHFFYYGPFATNDEEVVQTINFGRNIVRTSWWKITTCAEDPQGNPVTSTMDVATTHYAKKIKDQTVTNKDAALKILQQLIQKDNLGEDPNDIYVLFLHDDITATWLCDPSDGACGYHYFYNASRGNIKYIIIGGGGTIGMKCAPCQGPNGPHTPLTNQMVNSLASHLIRTVTDPVPLTGWYDDNTKENGQKCAGQFLQATSSSNNGQKNINVNNNDYLIQANWDLPGSKCSMVPTQDCKKVAPTRPITSTPHSGASIQTSLFTVLSVALFSLLFLF